MQSADRQEFAKILNGLALMKPGASKLAPEALSLWWNAMQDWDLDEFRAAANHLARSVEFMPSPYHFEQLRKAGQQTAGEAFERARRIVRTLFPRQYASHESGDPRLDAAIRACGGFEALAMCTTENIGFFERRFCEHYDAISDVEDVRQALPSVTGGPRLTGPQSAGDALKRIGRQP